MDFESILHNAVAAEKAKKLANSPILSLGELLALLKGIPIEKGKDVRFDFGSAIPTEFASSRGSYDELAIGYKLTGYDNDEEHHVETSLKDFVKQAEKTIGKTFTGWKGGDFIMSKRTPVWVDNPGNWSSTALVGVRDVGYTVILETKYDGGEE